MMTVTHVTVQSVPRRVEGVGHKLCMERYPFIICCPAHELLTGNVIVRQNYEVMPGDLEKENLKYFGGVVTAVIWKDH